jgi:hypothetical protein
MNPLVARLEDEFHAQANKAHLKALHAARDLNGLYEYALLLAEVEAMGRTKVNWLAREAMRQPAPVEECHRQWAAEILGTRDPITGLEVA